MFIYYIIYNSIGGIIYFKVQGGHLYYYVLLTVSMFIIFSLYLLFTLYIPLQLHIIVYTYI